MIFKNEQLGVNSLGRSIKLVFELSPSLVIVPDSACSFVERDALLRAFRTNTTELLDE